MEYDEAEEKIVGTSSIVLRPQTLSPTSVCRRVSEAKRRK